MSKEKLLISAQKNLEKGQIAKAIKDYQKVVEADPKDIRHRQKLAELYSRARQNEQALAEYGAVAKNYADNGFYLKAIAVYKQMQRLDSGRPELYLRLAELNKKQGLAGNAAAEYRNLILFYEERKMFPEAVSALEKLKELEPDNFNVRVKMVETFLRGGVPDRAKKELEEVLELLRQKGDFARSLRLYDLFLPLHPNDPLLRAGYGEALIRQGEYEKGLQVLEQLSSEEQDCPQVLQALAAGYRQKGDFTREELVLRQSLQLEPDRVDVREAHIRSLIARGDAHRALTEVERWQNLLLTGGRGDALREICVSLAAALPHDPRPRRLLTGCGEGSAPSAVPAGETAPEEEIVFPDPSPVAAGPQEVGAPPPNPPAVAPAPPVPESAASGEAEELSLAELSFAEEIPPPAGDDSQRETPVGSPPLLVDHRDPSPSEGKATPPLPAAEAAVAEEEEEPVEAEIELELDFDLEMDFPEEPAAAALPPDPSPVEDDPELAILDLTEEDAEVATTVDREAIQEARFYLAQGLREEAEAVCRRLQAQSPGDAAVLEMLAEIRAGREAGPAGAAEGFIDLGAGLLDNEEEASLSSVFAEAPVAPPPAAKKGIRTDTVRLEDAESHFQLGIAYKEMGLIDDAVREFEQAMRDPDRGVACLILKGICLAGKGEKEQAEIAFKAGLGHPRLAPSEKLNLHFELGYLYESCGRLLDALDSYQFVADQDLFFRQVGERMVDLRRRLGLDGGAEVDGGGAKGNRKRVSYI